MIINYTKATKVETNNLKNIYNTKKLDNEINLWKSEKKKYIYCENLNNDNYFNYIYIIILIYIIIQNMNGIILNFAKLQ